MQKLTKRKIELILNAAKAINATVVIDFGIDTKVKGKVWCVNGDEVILEHNRETIHDLFYCSMQSIKIKINAS